MAPFFEEPAEREHRPGWAEVPVDIVEKIKNLVGDKISRAEIGWGGYSPTAVFVVTLAAGKKVFIKGTHPQQEAHGTQMLRQEIGAYQTIPLLRGNAPAYLGMVSDGREDGWMLAAFEYIETMPTLPWTLEKIEKVFSLLACFHTNENVLKTLPAAHERNFIEKFLRPEGGWLRIKEDRVVAEKFLSLFEDTDAGRQWLAYALPVLCEWQKKVTCLPMSPSILHQDLRSDNILFSADGRLYLVDWTNVCHGPAALDIAAFLPSICAESTFDAECLLGLYEKISGTSVSREELTISLASLSGHMADSAYRLVPKKLPRLRWVQKSTLWAMLAWVVPLMGLPPVPRFKGLLR